MQRKAIPNIIANWKMSEGKEGFPKTKKTDEKYFWLEGDKIDTHRILGIISWLNILGRLFGNIQSISIQTNFQH